ncbi:glycosyltransferase family 4 protein [Phocaeicola sp.]
MEATFFYDIRFIKNGNETYSHFGVNNKYVDVYKKLFDNVRVVSRGEIIKNSNKCFLTEIYKISSFEVVTYNENYSNIFSVIKEEVLSTDFCILRFPSLSGVVAQFYCHKYGKPYVSEVVGNIFEALWYYNLKGKILAYPLHLLNKWAIYRSKYVSYITESYLQSVYPTHGIMGNGVANVSFDNLDGSLFTKRLVEVCLLGSKDCIIIGLAGSYDAYFKGHDIAIKAMRKIKEKGINCRLVCIGPGNADKLKRIAIQNKVEDLVDFDGFLMGRDYVLKWLDGIDIYIQPSRTEGHGRAVVEAISRGCVTLSSDVGGLKDSVPLYGRFRKNSYTRLADLIVEIIKNKDFAYKLLFDEIENVKKYTSKNVDNKRKTLFYQALYNKD